MSKWVKYTAALIPLLGAATPIHLVNVVIWPLVGGLLYGWFSERRRDIATSPVVALTPVLVVTLYYMSLNFTRFFRYIEMLPTAVILWITSWMLFFSLGAMVGYVYKKSRGNSLARTRREAASLQSGETH